MPKPSADKPKPRKKRKKVNHKGGKPPKQQPSGKRNAGAKKNRFRHEAVAALMECDSLTEAADQVGIAERTFRKWMKEPEFVEVWRKAKREALDHSIGRLQVRTSDAVKVLHEIMLDDEAPAGQRVRAAAEILTFAMRGAEHVDMSERLEELEQRGLSDELGETTLADWLLATVTAGPADGSATNRLN